ncbi:hypothetical protein [Burkholderia sp. Ac-20349]|uniref:hypothetical protein n=1 Tax=Burkholderia sp. Ac-20349 TaxID=2703893 RepID=UPI00197C86EB|nr:hypothetical protein [Burkholderia sp. Ac-20349]MBN3839260.1 hypothetical protein [Burkholderia sp. Ac-20349]
MTDSRKITVEFDPEYLRASMSLWRESTDLQIPMMDEFKIHFMQNRRPILLGFVKTGKAWEAMLRAMTATAGASELQQLRDEVDGFIAWAEAGLHALNVLAGER